MNVTKVITKEYEHISNWTLGENEPKTNPIKPNFRGKKMLLRMAINTRRKSRGYYADGRLFDRQILSRRQEFLAANYEVKLDFSINYV